MVKVDDDSGAARTTDFLRDAEADPTGTTGDSDLVFHCGQRRTSSGYHPWNNGVERHGLPP